MLLYYLQHYEGAKVKAKGLHLYYVKMNNCAAIVFFRLKKLVFIFNQ
jgi:hypothetical protein